MSLKVIIFGASGMVGRGVLLECLESSEIEKVLMVNRYDIGVKHDKLKQIIHSDFENYSSIEEDLKGYDACFWTLGISAVGLSEEKYTKITYDYTLTLARLFYSKNPLMTFTYVSGEGTDSTENGRQMWARVKGKTENDLLALGFKRAYMFRPGYIQPKKGVKSKTGWYNVMYVLFSWLYPLFKAIGPNSVTTTIDIGQAMIRCAIDGYEKNILRPRDINSLSK